jgi:hypothetical protein
MANYPSMSTGAKSSIRPAQLKKTKIMKKTIKQRLRNWLLDSDIDDAECYPVSIEHDTLQSDGMKLQIYKAAGGFVVETRKYDRRKDENINTMHVITDEQDLGECLGKIVMLEALR